MRLTYHDAVTLSALAVFGLSVAANTLPLAWLRRRDRRRLRKAGAL